MNVMRPPRKNEHIALTDLCLRSKAHWGYDETFMLQCREELTLTESGIRNGHFRVTETDGILSGLAQITIAEYDAELELLYVDPDFMGRGLGRTLFQWAVTEAGNLGARTLVIVADPHAQSFYEHVGAKVIGTCPSGSIPGRHLPRLILRVRHH